MMNFFKGKKLVGINAIMAHFDVEFVHTITRWIICFELPAKKENGQWIAYTSDLKKWRKEYPDVTETPSWQPAEKIEYRKVKTRWGLDKIEHRKIIY